MQNELSHYGVKGMKWGVRRYQNSDGSLTSKGKKRYSKVGKISKEEWKAGGRFATGAVAGETIGYAAGKATGMAIESMTNVPINSSGLGRLFGHLLAQKYSDEYSRDGEYFVKKIFKKH